MDFSALKIKKLSVKFLLALGLVLIISLAIVAESVFFTKSISKLEETNQNLNRLLVTVHKLEKNKNDFLDKGYRSDEFLNTGFVNSLVDHNDLLLDLKEGLDMIDRDNLYDLHPEIVGRIDTIHASLETYTVLFNKIVNKAYKIGNDNNSIFLNLEKEVRKIQRSGVKYDRALFDKVRVAELEFLFHEDVAHFNRFDKYFYEFSKHVEDLDNTYRFAPHEERLAYSDLKEALNSYHVNFNAIVHLEHELGAAMGNGLNNNVINDINRECTHIVNEFHEIIEKAEEEVLGGVTSSNIYLIVLFAIQLVVIALFILYFVLSLIRPVVLIRNMAEMLSVGDLPEIKETSMKDEIGQTIVYMNRLINRTENASNFAYSIGQGNFDSDFEASSEVDRLGNALINMKDNLHEARRLRSEAEEEDRKRNWISGGLASFVDVIRQSQSSIENLAYTITSQLVKYIDANQGSMYLMEHDEYENKDYLVLKSCYAYDKKKYLEGKYEISEGLIGQSYMEKDTIYLTNVPDGYVSITSGLGEATPNSVLIVPLKVNEEVHGVLELASFKEFETHVIEFVEKIAESIASTISTVKVNQRTKALLEDSQKMSESLKDREEEMERNQQDIIATTEMMEKKLKEAEIMVDKFKSNENMYLTEINNLKQELKDANFRVLCLRKDLERKEEDSF